MKKNLTNCKVCGHEIAKNAKTCPNCGAKNKKPFYKRTWFIVLAVLVVLSMITSGGKHERDEYAVRTTPKPTPKIVETTSKEDDETLEKATEAEKKEEEAIEEIKEEKTPASGIRPEVKEAIDEYEVFMNSYCDFMETYDESDTSAMLKYLDVLAKYADAEEDFAALENELTDEETLYYVKVMNRVNERLLEISVKKG